MSLKFKTKEEILGITPSGKEGKDVSIAQTRAIDMGNLLQKSLGEIIDSGESPRKIVEKVEKWCPLLNAQTVIGHANISKIKGKPYYAPLFNILSKRKPEKFVIKDVIKWLEAEGFTEGDAQRKVLASLICMGFVKKIRETSKKKGKNYFSWNEEVKPCKHYKNDSCDLNWKNADETNFYTHQYLDELEEEK